MQDATAPESASDRGTFPQRDLTGEPAPAPIPRSIPAPTGAACQPLRGPVGAPAPTPPEPECQPGRQLGSPAAADSSCTDFGPWVPLLGSVLIASQALAVGRFSGYGHPLCLNPAMRTLLGGSSPDRPRRDYLVNPNFGRLLDLQPIGLGDGLDQSQVFAGWLTIGDGYRQDRSLRGRVYRAHQEVLVVAEYEVAELERLERELSRTNQEICNLQRNLVRKNVRLEQTLAEVERQLQALRDSEQRLRQIVEHIADPVMVTDAAGRIRSVNPAFTRVTGYTVAEVLGATPKMLASGRHPPAFYEAMWAELATRGHWRGTIWNRRKDGLLFVQRLSISALRDSTGEELFVAVYNDIGAELEALERAQFMAEHDALTGLPNQVLLLDRLAEALAAARERAHLVAVMLIDLDHFKPINDTHGHAVGDTVLQLAARRIARCIRAIDTVARLGGDEFVVVLRDLPTTAPAARVAEQLVACLTRPLRLPVGLRLQVGASIGVAIGPVGDEDAAALLVRADAAMYEVKRERHGEGGWSRPVPARRGRST